MSKKNSLLLEVLGVLHDYRRGLSQHKKSRVFKLLRDYVHNSLSRIMEIVTPGDITVWAIVPTIRMIGYLKSLRSAM